MILVYFLGDVNLKQINVGLAYRIVGRIKKIGAALIIWQPR